MIHRTRIVTFPRSGHHWLVRMLQHALGDEMVYSEYHETGVTLESDPTVNVQKCHDFELDLPYKPEFRHVVQVREFLPAVLSWWKIYKGWESKSAPELIRFIQEKQEFYKLWNRRWRYNCEPILIVRYEILSQNPKYSVSRALRWITDKSDDECERLAAIAVSYLPPHEDSIRTNPH
jgi:hypothetical protein